MRWRQANLKYGSIKFHYGQQSVLGLQTRNVLPKHLRPNYNACRLLSSHAVDGNHFSRGSSLRDHPPNEHDAVYVNGIVRSIRKQKRIAFAHISDGYSLEPIQAILDPAQAKDITNGSYVELSGNWKSSPGEGQTFELHVSEIIRTGETNPDEYPIQKKSQTVDHLRTVPHLRMRTPLYSLIARTRSQLMLAIHDFYTKSRPSGPAIQVHPPLITSSDCEGAGEVFTITPKISAGKASPTMQAQSYFRGNKYLTVSTQLHLEAYAAELGDVWTLSPTFRAEESDTPRHLSEFYMLEAEFRGVSSLKSLMLEVQLLLRHVVSDLAGSSAGRDLVAYYSDPKYRTTDDGLPLRIEDRWQRVLSKEWPEISYMDAIKYLETAQSETPDRFVHPINSATGLQLEHERFLVEHFAKGLPLFVTHYPQSIKPFYMLPSNAAEDEQSGSTEETFACFDLLFPFGTAEIVGGSLREHRLPNLIDTMRQKGLIKTPAPLSSGQSDLAERHETQGSDTVSPRYPLLKEGEILGSLEWYADLIRYGTSPHGGFGMGFDRLLAYVSGTASIRDTVGFPRYFGRADC